MTFPALWLLVIFGVVFLGLVIMAIVHLFHAWRFGEHTPLTAITSGVFLLGIIAIVGLAAALLRGVDWGQSYDITLPAVDAPIPTELPMP